ncbi:MAG TPA: HetP family heterocyst commitment protein [Chroococcales cyanobacterium]|jgi:hypothetical protein
MTQHIPCSKIRSSQAISTEQLNQIIDAILRGKYSWACVLLLSAAGYEPLQYIPYRTYNRLLKENRNIGKPNTAKTIPIHKNYQDSTHRADRTSAPKALNEISDLAYLETIDEPSHPLKGGHLESCGFSPLEIQLHQFFKKNLPIWQPSGDRNFLISQ